MPTDHENASVRESRAGRASRKGASDDKTFDCLGVGAGPANLSLACQLAGSGLDSLFLDRKSLFDWHEGMQIEGSRLQVSIFKDLVTLADPTNPFSFVSYLHQTGRLYHFLNAQFETVTRREFADYLSWTSSRLGTVTHGESVEDITFDGEFKVCTNRRNLRARNICVAVGKTAQVPGFAEGQLGERMFHSSEFTFRGTSLGGRRVMIVGGGQSGAEIFLDCISRKGAEAPAHVHWVSSRPNFLPIDDSPFTNDLFMPCHVAHFEDRSPEAREAYIREHVLASDGISLHTLRSIYQTLYNQRFVGSNEVSATLVPGRRVSAVAPNGQGWTARLEHKDGHASETVPVDTMILATGYRNGATPFLDRLRTGFDTVSGEIRVDEDYAVKWDGPKDRSIFIQNATRGQKGLADPNLSLVAWRAQRILNRICDGCHGHPSALPSFIAWRPEVAEAAVEDCLREYA